MVQSIKRGISLWVMLTVLAFVVGICTAGTAQAAGINCNQLITDNAGILHDTSGIKASAQSLTREGAEPHVLTFQSLPNGTLDQSVKGVVDGCKSWQGVNGGTKSNLVIFAVSTQPHKVGIFYGDRWDNAFTGENSETQIWQNYMVPDLQDGNYSQAFVDGMKQAKQALHEYQNPKLPNVQEPAQAPVVVHEGPSSAPKVVGIIFGSLIFLALLCLGIWLWLRKRQEEGDRRAMRQRALSASQAASEINNALNDTAESAVRKVKVKKYSAVSAEYAAKLEALSNTVEENLTRSSEIIRAAAAAGEDADAPKLTTGEYEELAKRYEDALARSQAAEQAAHEIDATADTLESQKAEAQQDITNCEAELQSLNKKVAALDAEGIKADTVQAACNDALASLNLAKEHQADLSVLTHLATVKATLEKGETIEQTIRRQRKELEAGLPALQQRIQQVTDRLAPAKQCFDRISTTYAKSSWESVSGNGSAATHQIEAAKQALAAATEHSSTEKQEWQLATEAMQSGNHLLDAADSYLNSITELEKNLAHAKETAPHEIADAQADIDKAERFMQQYDSDVDDDLENDLRNARDTLEAAKREFNQDKPDYLQVVKLALDANHHADSIFEKASSEHEAAERLRRQAASMLTQSKASYSQAKEYIEDHSSDVRSGAEDLLESAKSQLTKAQAANDPATVLAAARQADSDATQAYEEARRNVNDAEEEREAERNRNNYGGGGFGSGFGTGVVIGSSLGSSSGGFGGGFGGSSGSFGGGGSLGGSSGGW